MSGQPASFQEIMESDIDEVRLLHFTVFEKSGREIQFGLNTHKIREVIEWENLSPLSEGLLPFIGVYDLRGVPVPVIDISLKLVNNLTVKKDRPRPRILICEVMNRLVGLLVQKTSQISLHSNQDILPAPEDLVGVSDSFINGLIKLDQGRFICMLDIEGLLATTVPEQNAKSVGSVNALPGLHILIVEDSKVFQKRATQYFEKLQCTYDIAGDGAQGLGKLKNSNKKYDAVFTDIEMPIMNGIEMVVAMKSDEKLKNIPVIFNSSISNPALIEEVKQRGLGQYVVKFDPQLIAEAIRVAVSSK